MGQAKLRSKEIAALKAQNPKMKDVVMFGAYYHDDLDDGVSIQFATFQDPKPGFTRLMYNTIKKCKDHMMAEIDAGEIDRQYVWDQLREAIVAFNFNNFGSNNRPLRSNYNIDVVGSMGEIVVIMGNIWVLTELGEIVNDNFNGMNFAYVG